MRLRRSANAALSLPLGEGAVTDEGSPLKAGFTAARTLANLRLAAVAASAPSEGFGFRAPPVADTARRQAAAVRKCESE